MLAALAADVDLAALTERLPMNLSGAELYARERLEADRRAPNGAKSSA